MKETILAEFLTARIAEDEAVAREAECMNVAIQTRDGWDGEKDLRLVGEMANRGRWEMTSWGTPHMLSHIARHDPARVLAECEAKRRMMRRHDDHSSLRILALPYADHPDYREEWALTTPKETTP